MINKKAVAILGGILLLIIGTIGFLIYQRSQNKEPVDTSPPPPPAVIIDDTPPPGDITPPPDEFPPAELPPPPVSVNTPQKLTEAGVLGPVLFYQGNGIAYMNSNGQLFQADLQESVGQVGVGNLQELVIPQRIGITRVVWPNAGNNFMIERMEAGNIRFSVYVSDKGEYVDLPKEVKSVVWMPGGEQILYVWLDGNNKSTLNIANADNTGWVTITDFWEPDNAITVSPDGRSVAFWQTQNQAQPNKLNLATIDGKVFKSAVPTGFNFGASWSPDSRSIVFLKRELEKTSLWSVNLSNGEARNLNVEVSSIDKVIWSADSRTLYTAGSKDGNSEQLHKIEVASGSIQSSDIDGSDIKEPFLNASGTVLLFRNAADSDRLYYLNLSGLGQ